MTWSSAFRRYGHTIAVLTTTFGSQVDDSDPEVHRRLGLYCDGNAVVCPSLLQQFRRERANEREFSRLLCSFRPDLISVWGMGAMSLGLLSVAETCGLPIVYVVGDDWLVYGRWADCWTRNLTTRSKLAQRIARAFGAPVAPETFGKKSTFCFVSDFTRRRAQEGGGVELAAAQVIHAGIDPGDFPLAQAEERPWRWRILCVGRLAPDKAFHLVIRALAELPTEATLTIIGSSGPSAYRDELGRLAREAGTEQRIFWRHCDRSEMAAHYRAADVLVFPSIGHEGFGLVPLEAMACATPVVASGAGGSSEFLVDGENCVLFPSGNAEALVAALWRPSRDALLRSRIVAGGLAAAARLTVDRQARELDAVHRAAVARKG